MKNFFITWGGSLIVTIGGCILAKQTGTLNDSEFNLAITLSWFGPPILLLGIYVVSFFGRRKE